MPDPILAGTDAKGNPMVACALCSEVVPVDDAPHGLCPSCAVERRRLLAEDG